MTELFLKISPQIKNSSKRGLFHPSDIKTVGLTSDSSVPKSAPPSSVSTVSSVSTPSILSTPSVASKPNETRRSPPSLQDLPSRPSSHSRSTSFAGGSSTRSDGKRTPSQAELQRYTENEEEDYEEIFGKPNAFCMEWLLCLDSRLIVPRSVGATYADFTA